MYDVVIVGASVSGCATAIRMGRAGLRVALVEKHRSRATAKTLCGHFILGGGYDDLVDLGLLEPLLASGAGTGQVDLCTDAGWIGEKSGQVPPFVSARRTVLDPVLRAQAERTAGVDLLLGHTVVELVRDGGRVAGVRARTDADVHEIRARLVVGADGHRSKVAELADVPAEEFPNGRGFVYGYFRGPARAGRAQVWVRGETWSVINPTDDGLTMVATMTAQDRMPEGQPGPDYLVQHVKTLPGGPDLTDCEPVGRVVLSRNYPLIRRNPTPEPGLALVGDAAITGDPTPATGITWAMRSALWLCQTTTPALVAHDDLAPALAAYRRLHSRISRELSFQRSGASHLDPNPVQRLMWRAGTVDPEIAWRVSLVGSAVAPATSLLRPGVLLRAVRARRATTERPRSQATSPQPSLPA